VNPRALSLLDIGPQVRVRISQHPQESAELAELGLEPRSVDVTLLVDTGAPHTLIEAAALAPLQLAVHTTYTFNAFAMRTRQRCPLHLAHLAVFTDAGVVGLDTMIAASSDLIPPGAYQGLLGRSSLQRLRFVYDGPAGTFSIGKP
jgi:hypothetical protein